MSLTRYSHFIIAFLLMAFTSQLLANAAMTCEFKNSVQATTADAAEHVHHHMSEMPAHDMTAMDHSAHSDSSSQNHKQSNCCKAMGHCLFSSCSFAAAQRSAIFSLTKQLSVTVDFYSSNVPTPLIAPLFRPPIFC